MSQPPGLSHALAKKSKNNGKCSDLKRITTRQNYSNPLFKKKKSPVHTTLRQKTPSSDVMEMTG